MKTLLASLCCVLSAFVIGAITLSVHYSKQVTQTRQQWQSDTHLANIKLDDYADITESNRQVIASLQREAGQLNALLAVTNDLNAQLASANAKIQSLEAVEQQRESDAILIPPPTVIGNAFFFPRVLSAENLVLATNATFAYITGRRLVFHPENQIAVVVDVDKINPLILQYLGIKPENAKAKQAKIDAANVEYQQAGAVAQTQAIKEMQI